MQLSAALTDRLSNTSITGLGELSGCRWSRATLCFFVERTFASDAMVGAGRSTDTEQPTPVSPPKPTDQISCAYVPSPSREA